MLAAPWPERNRQNRGSGLLLIVMQDFVFRQCIVSLSS